jgi:hypothetical protein
MTSQIKISIEIVHKIMRFEKGKLQPVDIRIDLKLKLQMSRVTTKPTKCVCDQHGSRPACASAQTDQDNNNNNNL